MSFAVHFKNHFFCTWKYCTFYNFKQIQKCLENIQTLVNYLTEKNMFKMIFPHRGIIRFDNSVWDFWWRYNGKSIHNSVWVLFTNFWNEQSSHTTSGSASQRMSQLKTFDYSIYIRTESSLCLLSPSPNWHSISV